MNTGEKIAGRYEVLDCLNDTGGMGCVMRARDELAGNEIAIKYFRHSGDQALKERFRREVRLMQSMIDSPMVVKVLDADLEHEPPYFVMPIYEGGDLSLVSTEINGNHEKQRAIMFAMCDAVGALHERGHFHRDIKPANFLRDRDGKVVISDLGFALDPTSSTRQTLSQQGWGTEGYTPPEFRESGGFKHASEAADLFMLGRAFYQVLTGRDPLFVDSTAVEKPLYFVIDKCCKINPSARFSSVEELKSALGLAFDHLTGRLDVNSEALSKFEIIKSRLESHKYRKEEVEDFLERALSLDPSELFDILREAETRFFASISQEVFSAKLPDFLDAYEAALDGATNLDFGYAEIVASNMASVFRTTGDDDVRLQALTIAVDWSDRMNRFAAMSTCSNLISTVSDGESIAHGIVALIGDREMSFIRNIEPGECKNPLIANALRRHSDS